MGRSRFVLTPLSLSLDQLLFLITAALLCFGLIMVQSADSRVRGLHENWLAQSFNSKNALHAGIALFVMMALWRFDYRVLLGRPGHKLSILSSPSTWFLVLTVGLLLAVLATPLGLEFNGARRWLALGPIGFQPSELAKLSLVLFVAAYAMLCRNEVGNFGLAAVPLILLAGALGVFGVKYSMVEKLHFFSGDMGPMRLLITQVCTAVGCVLGAGVVWGMGYGPRKWTWGFVPLVVGFGMCVALVLKEDFGTAALLSVVVLIMMLMAGCRWWQVALLIPPGAFVVWAAIFRDPTSFRYRRMMAFLDPFADMKGAGFHPAESLLTLASGGFWGLGLGNGIQKMGYLPEDNVDFIFAVICEELGFCGALMVIGLFAAFVIVGWRVMSRCQNLFGKMVAFGITAMIGLQAAFNIAVVTVTVPTKGIALPFISSGGTGWIMNAAAIGVLMSIERVNRLEREAAEQLSHGASFGQGFPIEIPAVMAVPVVAATPAVSATPAVPAHPVEAAA